MNCAADPICLPDIFPAPSIVCARQFWMSKPTSVKERKWDHKVPHPWSLLQGYIRGNVPQEYHLPCSVLLLQVAPNYLSMWLHHINTQNTDRKVDFLFHLLSCFEYSSLYKIAVNSGQAIQPILELRIGNKVKFCKPNFTTRPFKKSRFATIIFINFKRKLKGRLGYSVTNKSIFHIVG